MFGNHGLCGLLEEGAHGKSPKCLDGNLGDFGEFCKGLYLPFRAAGIGTEQVAVKSCFIQINTLVVGKFGQLCQIMRYFGRVLFFVSGGLFLRVIPICLSA